MAFHLAMAARRGALAALPALQQVSAGANPVCLALAALSSRAAHSTLAFEGATDLATQPAAAPPAATASQGGRPGDNSPAAGAAELDSFPQPLDPGLAAGPAAADAGEGSSAGEPAASLLSRVRQAQAEGRHAAALALFGGGSFWEGLPRAEQQALFDAALHSCAELGSGRRALRFAAALWRRPGLFVGPRSHLNVLQALCGAGMLAEAARYLADIPTRRLRPFMCNAVLVAAVNRGELGVARQVEAMLTRRGLQPEPLAQAAIIELRGMEGDAAGVEAAWRAALEAAPPLAQHAMLHAARVIGLARAGTLDAAIAAAEEMMDALAEAHPGLLPVDISAPSLLSFYRRPAPPESAAESGASASAAAAAAAAGAAAAAPSHGGGPVAAAGTAASGASSQGHTTPLEYLKGACNAILKQAEETDDQAAAKRITHLMTLRGLPPTTTTYNLLLRAAVRRAGGPTAALAAVEGCLQEMEALGVPPSRETLHLPLEAPGAAGDLFGVRAALDAMVAAGWAPGSAAWAAAMWYSGVAGDLQGLAEASAQLLANSERLTAETFATAFGAVRAWGEFEASGRALKEGSTATQVNTRIHQRQIAEDVLYRWLAAMEERRVRHSPASLVALMGALGYAGPPELAAELLQRAYAPAASGAEAGGSSSAAPADAAAAGVAAAELQQEGVEEKRQVQQQPQEQQQQQQKQQQTDGESREQPLFGQHSLEPGALAPDARAFSAGIGACCRQGRMEEALGLLRLMRDCGLHPGAHQYTSVIACCAYVRMPRLARTLFAEMKAGGLVPDVHVHNALLKVETHVGSLDAAVKLVQDMELKGPAPDAVSWRTLLSAAKYLGRDDIADLARIRMLGAPEEGEEEGEEQNYTEQAEQAAAEEGRAAAAEPQAGAEVEGWQSYYASSSESEEEDGVP